MTPGNAVANISIKGEVITGMQIDFTVAIPTYNGAKRFPLVLERLRSQINLDQVNWEIIIIDNNSTDDTAKIVQDYQSEWGQNCSLSYYFEPQQGLAFARQRAVEEANGTFVGFLDDDNLPAPNWVSAAFRFGQTHPKAGAYGGQIRADYEVEPTTNVEYVQNLLVIRKYSDQPKLFEPEKLRLPPGAGLVIRKRAWLESVPKHLVHTSGGGDDYEISLHLYKQGWEIWHNPAMQIDHRIPPWRLEKSYLMAIARTYGICTCSLLMILTDPWQSPIVLSKSFIGSLRRMLLHLLKYREKVNTELGPACEMAFFIGNLISPFHYFREQFIRRDTSKQY
jgi:glycosyltransferase involved in cell wall biosynthesis